MANHFDELGENYYDNGHTYRQSSDWTNAKENYLKSVAAKRKARKLEPDNQSRKNVFFTHKRLYAQLLIDADKHNFSAADCQIIEIMKESIDNQRYPLPAT